ncbi:type II secretion system major pseudopilin GspG [uncultured Tateyamaria sp.]|uniref:type II secretion system major pseudopilin GspG n=1 Tax=Tateyamaria sp. 1078 TaxID=3417464 RepID=UPI00262D6B0F|nr:type II secretion system major pseudopilin GspG [uncultured Tateyamaria sp.]
MIVRRKNRWTARTGATILEVLIVLSIIALIAAVVGPRVIGYLGTAKSETADLQINNLASAVQLFYVDTGRYPTEAEGLSVLLTRPAGDTDWNGPYMPTAEALVDPWGRDYLYAPPADDDSFGIRSLGRDGAEGGSGEDADLAY